MFDLNENFLKELNLEDLPEEQRATFLQYVEKEMDQRIGRRISEKLSDEQFEQFSKLAEGDSEVMRAALEEAGDYKASEEYKMLVEVAGGDSAELEGEYASMAWISKHVPGYEDIVDEEVNKLTEEIKANRDKILSA